MDPHFDWRVYNAFAVRVAALEPDSKKLKPEAQVHRWECWHTILVEAMDADMVAPIMDLMSQSGHDAWNPTVKAHASNLRRPATGGWLATPERSADDDGGCDRGSV